MTYKSPFLSYENLALSQKNINSALLEAVIARRKPMAFLSHRHKRPLRKLEGYAQENILGTALTDYKFPEGYSAFFLTISLREKIGAIYDTCKVLEFYESSHLDESTKAEIKGELDRIENMNFTDFFEFNDAEAYFGQPYQYVRTGLLLGYPLESTLALIRETQVRNKEWREKGILF